MTSLQLYEEDIKLLETFKCNAYRLSISWSRVIPKGGRDDPVNEKGLEYYDKVINALLEKGITPFVVSGFHALPGARSSKAIRLSIIGMFPWLSRRSTTCGS